MVMSIAMVHDSTMNAQFTTIPNGIIPIVQTPYTATGEIDCVALIRLVDYAIACGAAALIVPAVASEVERLSDIERKLIVKTVVEAAEARVSVIVGASSPDLSECIAHARYGRDCGCRAMLVQAPSGTETEIHDFFVELCKHVELDLILQDLDWNGSGLTLEFIERLSASLPRLRCIKVETRNACPKYTQILDRSKGRLSVAGGWAVMQMMEALDRGVHALMPESSMVRIYERIRRLHAGGEREKAWLLYERLLPVLAFSNQQLEISIHFFKRLLLRRGIFTTSRVRRPTITFDSVQELYSEEMIARVLMIEAALHS